MTVAQLSAELPEDVTYVFPLPHAPRAASVVRRGVRAVLTDWHLSADVAEDVLLLASELLTNAIIHALPPATLRMSQVLVDGLKAVHVEVTDAGPAAPADPSASGLDPDEHGRGIGIVMALSARHGVRECADGTSWWADVVVR
ncbi:anti-sigma regulatory factor (Ser/Thr protein kinase) [Streptomyces sp. V4I23]|uniref:ATP-binding protein n=1 Tax=Streptomyces sp. V4I23 TaxID=3042282 RepID=UPI002783D94C|nr:ATP-binding protein [Streptomyces sp. V4I23]MDQ1012953.1 anti-sigma regulatory factor (Ser/Thr protein kinase) [Streptomyces sp. V4I23]